MLVLRRIVGLRTLQMHQLGNSRHHAGRLILAAVPLMLCIFEHQRPEIIVGRHPVTYDALELVSVGQILGGHMQGGLVFGMVYDENKLLKARLVQGEYQALGHINEYLFKEVCVTHQMLALSLELIGLRSKGNRKAGDGLVSLLQQRLVGASDQRLRLIVVCTQREMCAVVLDSAEGKDDRLCLLHRLHQLHRRHLHHGFRPLDRIDGLPIFHHDFVPPKGLLLFS